MILCHASDDAGDLEDEVVRVASVDFEVERIPSLRHVRTLGRRAWCAVLVEARVSQATIDRLDRLRRVAPVLPRLVVVGARVPGEDARYVSGADGVVHAREIDPVLPREVRCVRARGIRALVRLHASCCVGMSPLVRRAIFAATRAPRPYRRVVALADSLGCGRNTLWRAWHAEPRTRGTPLERFLGWLLIVEAVSRKHRGVSWAAVAAQLGVHEQTLRRGAVRHAATTLAALAASSESLLSDDAVRERLARDLGPVTADELALE